MERAVGSHSRSDSLLIPRQVRVGPPPRLALKVRYQPLLSHPGELLHRGEVFPYTLHRPRPGALFIRWQGLGDYLIEGSGRRIVGRPAPRARNGEFRDLLLTTIASFAMLERGLEPLHASCVSYHGRAIAFAGRGGSGKSTLAALLARRGLEFLADDLLPLDARGRDIVAYPSVPEIKLDPNAARALGLNLGKLPPLGRGLRKRVWRLRGARSPRRLTVIYFPRLSTSARQLRMTPLSPSQAFNSALRFNFNPQLQTRQRLRHQFALFTRLGEQVRAWRLVIPRGWNKLEEVAERIESHLEDLRD